MTTIQRIEFQAKWTHESEPLCEEWEHLPLYERVWKVIVETLLCPICCLVECVRPLLMMAILPASKIPEELVQTIDDIWKDVWTPSQDAQKVKFLESYEPISLQMTAPDGTPISGIFYRYKLEAGQSDIPTILCLNPNGAVCKYMWYADLMAMCSVRKTPVHFVAFDYAGCGSSGGKVSTKRAILSAETAYQCIKDRLGIRERNIHILGRSLGGLIGAKLKEMHAETGGKYVNTLSLISFQAFIDDVTQLVDKALQMARARGYGPEQLRAKIRSGEIKIGLSDFLLEYFLGIYESDNARAGAVSFIQHIARVFLFLTGEEIDAREALQKIPPQDTLVLHAPGDDLIPEGAAVFPHCTDKHTVLALQPKLGKGVSSLHNAWYRHLQTENGTGALTEILNFILNDPAPQGGK